MRIKATHSKATTNNPKDLEAHKKVDLSTVPPVAILHEACALMTGNDKYGYHNWRDHPVLARIYYSAALRHLYAWFEGEELAPDSGVHHLGHARACLAILLDAAATGNLIDDRPLTEGLVFPEILSDLNEWATDRKTKYTLTDKGREALQEYIDFVTEQQNETSKDNSPPDLPF